MGSKVICGFGVLSLLIAMPAFSQEAQMAFAEVPAPVTCIVMTNTGSSLSFQLPRRVDCYSVAWNITATAQGKWTVTVLEKDTDPKEPFLANTWICEHKSNMNIPENVDAMDISSCTNSGSPLRYKRN